MLYVRIYDGHLDGFYTNDGYVKKVEMFFTKNHPVD